MSDEVQDFLSGGGAPTVSFPTKGTSVTGVIVASEIQVQRDLEGQIKTFDNGDPRKQLVVTLQTDLFDDEIPNDDGQRRVFLKAQATRALKDSLRKQGLPTIENGGRLTVTYTGDQAAEKRGYNPTKLFEVEYEAPVGVAASNATQQFLSDEEPF